MSLVRPREVLKQVADAIPEDCRENIVVIGSLAAAHAFFTDEDAMLVQTKDIDCMLRPFHLSAEKGISIFQCLRDRHWNPPSSGEFTDPGNAETADDRLPAIRLYPPGMNQDAPDSWFIELLSEPERSGDRSRRWIRLDTNEGHYGLPVFPF